jgi:hypothetical protein
VLSKITSKNSQITVQQHFSNEMKIHFFIEDTHLPPKISKCISSLTWSLVLQTRNLANKIEEFSKCDDFSGEIRSAHRYNLMFNNNSEGWTWKSESNRTNTRSLHHCKPKVAYRNSERRFGYIVHDLQRTEDLMCRKRVPHVCKMFTIGWRARVHLLHDGT